MKVSDKLDCMFSRWYNRFKKVTIQSRILPIPEDVLGYLLSDNELVLPSTHQPTSHDIKDEDDDTTWDSDAPTSVAPEFPEFSAAIHLLIEELGGAVMPKLNWSSPKDAVWISFDRTMRCTTSNDILLLLKSSEFVMHDLTKPFDTCDDYQPLYRDIVSAAAPRIFNYELVLRKWMDMTDGDEFRCFVAPLDRLVAISQRRENCEGQVTPSASEISRDITAFFNKHIKGNFQTRNDSFVFDVWIPEPHKVMLIDFNPWSETTDSLLFTWTELEEVRVDASAVLGTRLAEAVGIRCGAYQQYGMPLDMIDLCTGEDMQKFVDLMKITDNIMGNDKEDDDGDEVKRASAVGVTEDKLVNVSPLQTKYDSTDLNQNDSH